MASKLLSYRFKIQQGGRHELNSKRLENIWAAVAFAEAGEFETAREILKEEKYAEKRQRPRADQRPELRAPSVRR